MADMKPLLLLHLAFVFFATTFPSRAAHPFLYRDHNGGKVRVVPSDEKIPRVVWQFDGYADFKPIHQIQVLDSPDGVTNGRVLQ